MYYLSCTLVFSTHIVPIVPLSPCTVLHHTYIIKLIVRLFSDNVLHTFPLIVAPARTCVRETNHLQLYQITRVDPSAEFCYRFCLEFGEKQINLE